MHKRKPNVVFVITDDQGYGDMGCTGNPIIQTPNMDKLYEESIRFTDFHAGPTCAPSRAGLMTGHYHNSTGVWHTIGGRSLLRKGEVSLANIFRANGYHTGIFGKWHLGDCYPYRPHDRGFEEAIVHGGGGVGQTPDYWGNDYFDDTYFDKGVPRKFEGYCTDVWFRLGLDFIERHKEEPFFCYIPTNAPHFPFQIEEKYENLYKGKVPDRRAKFYGMITCIDENIGGLRRRLEELGLAENTILVFMTDNGSAEGCDIGEDGFVTGGFNAGMRGRKGSPYDGGHRVPFFFHWPEGGYSSGKDINELTAYVDFLPTLIDICGLNKPETLEFDGKSLVPLLQGRFSEWEDRTVVTDSQRVPYPVKWRRSSVMRKKWRLINGNELYDIASDPGQMHDLSAQYPQLAEQLRQDYEVWWEKVSRQFSMEIPISIGSDYEKTTCINSHDWRGDAPDCAWSQAQIREGKLCNSYVEIYVETDGLYSFELRRWPREEDRAICEGIPGETIGWFCGGKAIPVKEATLRIGDKEVTRPVTEKDRHITFELELKAGPAHLQTYLEDAEGNIRGAYYVYVRKL